MVLFLLYGSAERFKLRMTKNKKKGNKPSENADSSPRQEEPWAACSFAGALSKDRLPSSSSLYESDPMQFVISLLCYLPPKTL